MLIDWFTVAAQVANFLVLVLLLRRFLYTPILRVMAERQRGIDEQLTEAARLHEEASAEAERHRIAVERFANQHEERLRQSRDELDTERRARLKEARDEIDELQKRWWAAVEREREGFLTELRQRVAEQVVDVARRALEDLAGESLESRVVDRFLDRLEDLDPAHQATLARAALQDGGPVRVRTAFPLSPDVRDQLATAVDKALGTGHELRFEVAPRLVSGVELRAGGQSLAWTIEDYLESLEQTISSALAGEEQTGARD